MQLPTRKEKGGKLNLLGLHVYLQQKFTHIYWPILIPSDKCDIYASWPSGVQYGGAPEPSSSEY